MAMSDCAHLISCQSVSQLSISWFDCLMMALGCHSYDVQDEGLRAYWLHLLLMECGMKMMREEERGGSYHYQQQRWKSLRHSMWIVKERSPGCAAVGYH